MELRISNKVNTEEAQIEMDITELQKIEQEEAVQLRLNPNGSIGIKGKAMKIERAVARIADHREAVAELLSERQGEQEEVIERIVAASVPSLEIQKQNYIAWFSAKSAYYHPSQTQISKMFSVLEEGDEVLPDFAMSFSVRKPNGLLIQVDRRGRISQSSPYSPHVTGKRTE